MKKDLVIMDGNEAAATIAYKCSELCIIYPITPSSPMGEMADQWSNEGRRNYWGTVPEVVEMQSEGGASGALHGALQTGTLATTFTASQGLLLMIPNMYKIAGELTSAVIHVSARSLAAQALSIFGDHSDVMAVRSTGFAMLASSSVQEAHDMALIAEAATLQSRIPFVHFFDGFRTSHEISKIKLIPDEVIGAMIDDDLVIAHRQRGLTPENPVIRGTAQNPDVYFQGRETVNTFYEVTPDIVAETMDKFGELTGRNYKPFQYCGPEDAERVIIVMGSGAETIEETASFLQKEGEKVGLINVHLFRPFSTKYLLEVLPKSAKAIAILDRTKEPGAPGEPLYQDIVTALFESGFETTKVIGGRYGLSSKEFTPGMVKAIYDELKKENPKNHFTIGIKDDVTHTSLEWDPNFTVSPENVVRALFFGLGSDGTVGANKNTIKIIGEETDFYTQGFFAYDSKKAGTQTTSHLRFGPEPIQAAYTIHSANFIACHQFHFLHTVPLLQHATKNCTFLLNCPYGPKEAWNILPRSMQETIINKNIKFYVIDAYEVARETGMGNRINTIMQTCFFAISGVLPREEAIKKIKDSIEKTYSKKGEKIVEKNWNAVDKALDHLHEVNIPKEATSTIEMHKIVSDEAPEFVKNVTAKMMAGLGDQLPVSALPVDGTYPSGTTRWEKRNVSQTIAIWDPETCIQCGNCAFVCPHSCIRMKHYSEDELASAPEGFKSAPLSGRGYPDRRYTLQVYVEDCTGCTLCVEACPVRNPNVEGRKAINMGDKDPILEQEKTNTTFFETIPVNPRDEINFANVRGIQYLTPLFEFCGACAGCGETPYIKLVTQLFGDRMLIANATGCSSIFGGNLPTTPYTTNEEGRGPAWSNSLFEDNAEFGLGFRLSVDKHHNSAVEMLQNHRSELGDELVESVIHAPQNTEEEIFAQRKRIEQIKEKLAEMKDLSKTKHLLSLIDQCVRRSIWLIGGDGWAYDIGYGGLDHVLASGRNVNILVLDTEVYSNTGGQASKATPPAATAKFATGGKKTGKKDLALMAMIYNNVYVARIALGADPQQTLLAFREAEAYPGVSLILAYSPCIAHGINLDESLRQEKLAVQCGYWPLLRYNPKLIEAGENPLQLDSVRPAIPLKDYAYNELRYSMLAKTNPNKAGILLKTAQEDLDRRWETYEKMQRDGF